MAWVVEKCCDKTAVNNGRVSLEGKVRGELQLQFRHRLLVLTPVTTHDCPIDDH